jgi:hypothetical protein
LLGYKLEEEVQGGWKVQRGRGGGREVQAADERCRKRRRYVRDNTNDIPPPIITQGLTRLRLQVCTSQFDDDLVPVDAALSAVV